MALAACDTGGVGEPEAGATPSPQEPCGELNQASFQALGDGITAQTVLNIQTVPAALSGWWFVGGQVQGEDVEPGDDIAIWAVDEDPVDRLVEDFVAVNDPARAASDWPDAPPELTGTDPAIQQLLDCVADVG